MGCYSFMTESPGRRRTIAAPAGPLSAGWTTKKGSAGLADGSGDRFGAAAHLGAVAAFDHDADYRLGAGRTQQHAAAPIELALDIASPRFPSGTLSRTWG